MSDSDKTVLRQMEAAIRMSVAPAQDKVDIIDAIQTLIDIT